MTNEERFEEYIKENCKNCKHKNENLCNIQIFCLDGIVTTKCSYYEREKNNVINYIINNI